MAEQRTADVWFEAVRIPLDRTTPIETWIKCGHQHRFREEAGICGSTQPEGVWSVVKAKKIELKLP